MARFEYQRATSGAALAYSFEEEEPGTANDNDSDHLNPPREDTGGGHDTEDETAGAYTFSEIELLEAFELVQGDVGNIAFDWIVKGMIERGKAGILFGQNQSYKSFLIITLAVHIMAGMRFAGRRTKAKGQAFIYVPFEGKSSVNVRFREAMRAVGIKRGDGVALEMFHARPFNEPGAWEFFEAGLRRYKAKHGSISMVVVDTVNQARFFDGTAGSNENDPLAWGALYARLKALAVELDLTCLLVHHAGKSLENGGRGSSANTDDADFALTISTEKDLVTGVSKNHFLHQTKIKDGGGAGPICSIRAHEVVIGRDGDGDDETTLYLTLDDRDEYTAPEEGKSKAQTERQRNEGEQWKQAIIGAMRWQLEQPKMKAEIDAGRDVCVGMATINQGACNDVDPGDRKSKATKKTAFHRAVNDLIKEGVLIKDTTEDNAVVLGPGREWPVT